MSENTVVVTVKNEPAKGAELMVEGIVLARVVLSSRDWDEKASQVKHVPTLKVINALREFTGIKYVQIAPQKCGNLITIHCDSKREDIELAVADAFDVDLARTKQPPRPPLRFRNLRESYDEFMANRR